MKTNRQAGEVETHPSSLVPLPSSLVTRYSPLAPRYSPRGTILILVMAVLGLLLILGTAFITVTMTDKATTANVIRSSQADYAAKSAVNAAVEAIRRDLFDLTGQYLLTGNRVPSSGNVSVTTMVGEYMDYPDPDVDEWLSPITRNSSNLLSNVACIGTPVDSYFKDPAKRRNAPFSEGFIGSDGKRHEIRDTDRDGWPDGIWCQLPIASQAGEQWETCYKIIDLSGLVNLNTAIRPIPRVTTAGINGEAEPITESSLKTALARFQTGAETNGFLYDAFVDDSEFRSWNCKPGTYYNIGFYPLSPPTSDQQMWHLLGVALNPKNPPFFTWSGNSTRMNAFGLNDELEFRYCGGVVSRVVNLGGGGGWNDVYQSGRENVYSLLEAGNVASGWDPDTSSLRKHIKQYFTALSAQANYMVGDPRSINGASVRDGTLRGTNTKSDASANPPPKSLCSIWYEDPNNASSVSAKAIRSRARQYRVSIEALVNKAVSATASASGVESKDTPRGKYMTELADTFRYALDGYVNSTNAAAFIGDPISGVDPMDQLAAHMTANFVSLVGGDNIPVVFTYRKGESGEITVVGMVQFPVIQSVSNNGSSITLFNPWDTNISPSTMRIIQSIGDTQRTLDNDSIPLYGTDGKTLSPVVNLDDDTKSRKVYLVHKDRTNVILDAWNRDGNKTTRSGTTPTGVFGGPKGCASIFPRDPGVSPMPTTCQIRLSKPHVNITKQNTGLYNATNPPYSSSFCSSNSIYLYPQSRWMTAANIAMLPTFGSVIPSSNGNLDYASIKIWADRAAQCQNAYDANPSLVGPCLSTNATSYGEPGKINFLKTGNLTGNMSTNMAGGFDNLTPGQRFFSYVTKIDPLTDGYGTDVKAGSITDPLGHLDVTLYGQVNINTAPSYVLKYLPWTCRPPVTGDPSDSDYDRLITNLNRTTLASQIQTYRDNVNNRGGSSTDPRPGFLSVAELVGLTNVQVAAASANTRDPDYRTGDWWGAATATLPNVAPVANSPSNSDTVPIITGIGNDKMLGWDKVRGDLEERDLLFRNVCSMVTTRSDVFCVYVMVRSRNVSTNQISSQRWMYAIVDRTQVRNPSDIPVVYGPFENVK